MRAARYPAGMAEQFDMKEPTGIPPIVANVEQQADTPISETRTADHYATGLVGRREEISGAVLKRMDVVMTTFEEAREIIERQQKIWNLTPPICPSSFCPRTRGHI